MQFDRKAGALEISVKETVPNPFDEASLRHPVGCRRRATIAGKYAGGVFCNLTHFVSREAMNIDGLGSAIIDTLIEQKMIANPADLYSLDFEAFAALPGQGEKSAENLRKAIEASKGNDLSRLLCAFGIRQVGTKAAKVLAMTFGSLDALMAATEEELTAVPDVGQTTAESIRNWFADTG